MGWSSAPVSVLVPILDLLLDPEDAAGRPTLAQVARQRVSLGAVCRQWRLAVQQVGGHRCMCVLLPAPHSPTALHHHLALLSPASTGACRPTSAWWTTP